MISGCGVEMDPKKVIAMHDWTEPMTQHQVRGFLGLAGYYRHFIKGYATMAAPLTELLRKDGFRWGGQEAAAFQELKQQLSTAPILTTYQKELFAIVEAVYKWRQYLVGRRFKIRTNHKSIKELMQPYKPGVANQVADALSRMYEDEELVKAEFMAISQPIVGLLDYLKSENETLEELQVLHQQLDTGSGPDGFRREQGLLIFGNRYYVGTKSKLKALLLREFHDTSSAGYGGVKKMLVGLFALFYWRGMPKSVKDYIKQCTVCQQTKYSTQAVGVYLQPLPMAEGVYEDVSMDFITGLPLSKGFIVILVVVDRFSKYAHFGALPTNFNGHKVAELFMEIVVKHHGIPKTIVSDRDPIFVTMVSDRPQQWVRLLPWAEYCYNTSYHSSIKMSPYQALYGRLPLSLIPYPPGASKVAAVDEILMERNEVTRQLKQNLLAVKLRMKENANHKRRDVEFKNRKYERQVLVQWEGRSPEEATWEWLTDFQSAYPTCNHEDKVVSEDGGTVTPLVGRLGRGKRTKKAPKWQESFEMGYDLSAIFILFV
ncbi:ty3-gypsy retrotransposon protein [Tanacetum coccineum]